MKFILLSDIHLVWDNPICRKDLLRETQFKKLEFVLSYADKNDCRILQAGDFFNKPRSWYLLPEVIKILQKYHMVDIVTVFGQHDKYMYSEMVGNTNLGILDELNSIYFAVIGGGLSYNPDYEIFSVYGVGWGEEVQPVKNPESSNILIIHAPILTEKLWDSQTDYHYASGFLRRHPEFDLILCGDIHKKFLYKQDGRIICNTGPMLRISADLAGHHPGFWVYDTDQRDITEWVEIPHSPAEEVISKKHLEDEKKKEEMLSEFAEEILKNEEIEGNSFFENLDLLIKKENVSERVKKIIGNVVENEV